MNIFYFSSDLFVNVLAVSIVSLLENNKDENEINFYIVDDGITQDNKELLVDMVKQYEKNLKQRNVIFIEAPDPVSVLKYPFENRYQMGHSYVRMCIGSILPKDVERVICLDSDTLIRHSLNELWTIELKGNIMAGVSDCMNIRKYRYQLRMDDSAVYCNAGVYLIDLKKWREERIEQKIIDRIREQKGNVFFFEQTLMNWSCQGKVLELAPIYNSYTLFYAFEYRNLLRWRRPLRFFSEEQVNFAKKNPVIVHFTRNFYMTSRPWVYGCEHPMSKEYQQYKKITPWPDIIEKKDAIGMRIKHKILHMIPQSVLAEIVCIIYNYIRPKMIWKNE